MLEGIETENQYFHDIEPDEKPGIELSVMLLKEAAGEKISIRRYQESEIMRCARVLIIKGYLRGTVFTHDKCCWSRATPKGRILLRAMEKGYF